MKNRMFYLLFSQLLLLLLLLLLLCVPMCTAEDSGSNNAVELFKPEDKIKEFFRPDGNNGDGKKEITVKNVRSPSLVAVGDLMVALAEVNYTENGDENAVVDILAKYINTKEDNWGDEAAKGNSGKWKTQIVTENKKKQTGNQRVVKSSAVTVKDKKIYYIAVSNSTFEETEQSDDEKWHAQLVVGEVNNKNGEEKTIKWTIKETKDQFKTNKLEEKLSAKPAIIPPSDGFAFVTKEEKFIFIMKGEKKDNTKNTVTAVMQLTMPETQTKLEVLRDDNYDNSYPYFFQWNDKIMMILNNDQKNNGAKQTVKEFDFTTKKWEDSKESIARLSHFLNDKRDFTTARIGKNNKSVLLFTQHKPNSGSGGSGNKKDVHLWVTDGDHLSDVGTVAANIDGGGDYYYYGSILHTNNELFILQRKYDSNSGAAEEDKYELTRLKEQLEEIKKLLEIWKKADEVVLKICDDKSEGSSKKLCAAQLSTDGLVGLLRDTSTNSSEWVDEYYYINATVTGEAEKVGNGFKFNKKGAGAKWPVGKTQEEDQPYNFIHPGFTLVATVKIENSNVEKNGNSLLGVMIGEDGKKGGVGLWCTKDNKWGVTGGITEENMSPTTVGCKQGSEYQVALVLNASKVLVYVDWEKLKDITKEMRIEKKDNINHFYFGAGDGDKPAGTIKSHVTVRNVLLYNRPFTEDEIKALKVINETKENEGEVRDHKTPKKREGGTNTEGDEGTAGGSSADDGGKDTTVNDDSKNNGEKEEKISPSQLEVSVMRVDLLHLLFAVCTAVFLHN